MTTPARGKRVFLGAFKQPADGVSEAELDAWAGAVADAMIAAYRRSKEADPQRDLDADQSLPGPIAGAEAADDHEPV